LVQIGGEGGIIAVDRKGHIAMPYNGDGMHRGFVREGGPRTVAIYEK
jgi:beta-aspartyl-peptidase (threonine type)